MVRKSADARSVKGTYLDDRDMRLDHDELQKKKEAARRRAERANALMHTGDRNINKLWSDLSGNIVYENDHSCWDYFTAVN